MAELMAAVKKELEGYDVVSVKEVTILIGKLTNLGKEQLEFAYEVMSRDSILEGSKLIIEEEDIEVKCNKCGYEGGVNTMDIGGDAHYQVPILSCPECGNAVSITAGRACCVVSMDIEEAC